MRRNFWIEDWQWPPRFWIWRSGWGVDGNGELMRCGNLALGIVVVGWSEAVRGWSAW